MIIYPNLIESSLNIDEKIDFKDKIKDNNDIIDIKECFVLGTAKWELDNLIVDLTVDCLLVLASTRTLKPIEYRLTFPLNLIFGDHEEADFVLSNEIELGEIIYGHILLEKPLTIYNEDEELLVEEEKPIHPAFEVLKDFKL